MRITSLSQDVAEALRGEPFTCPVASPSCAPEGYAPCVTSATLKGTTPDAAAADLLAWRMHARSGLRVQASDVPLREGAVVLLRFGIGPVSLVAPCRVLEVIDEPFRTGFSYGTLPGHSESGVERFMVTRADDGQTVLRIDGYSRPQSWMARLAPALARAVQARVTRRYLRALDRE